MTAPLTQLEWLNRNSHRAYPLREDAPATLGGGGRLPNDVLVDLNAVVALESPDDVHVTSVSFTLKTVTVFLGQADGTTYGYATGVLGATAPNTSVPISSPSGLVTGHVTFGQILNTATYPDYSSMAGTHVQATPVPVESRAVIFCGRPMVESVSAYLQDGSASGDITLSLGAEFYATVIEETVDGCVETEVTIGLVTPENFLPECYPKYSDPRCYCDGNLITGINTVPPDDSGDIEILYGSGLGGGAVDTTPGSNLVTLDVQAAGRTLCPPDNIADQYGRLPPVFSNDCPPVTDYGAGPGPGCSNPPDSVPPPEP